ncbi:MAG: SpoIIE family protein phosphatase [Gemmataceae bacterium]
MALLRDPASGREFPLAARVVIGRDLSCDIRVSAGQASRRHAAIVQEGDAYFIEDLGSANGTSVNARPIQGRTRLQPHDQIDIGGFVFLFEKGGAPVGAGGLGGTEDLGAITSTLNIDAGSRTSVAPEAKLRAVLEISKNLSNALHLEAVLPKILDSLFTVFPQAERGVVLLFDRRTGQLRPRALRQRHSTRSAPPISQTILSHALKTGQALLSADAGQDERFDITQSVRSFGYRCLMCVPMLSQGGEPLGVIQVDGEASPGAFFSHDDLDVLVCVGGEAARAVELAQLYEARRDQEATEIQKSFLPSQRPTIAGLRFFDHYSSAQNIGGDYFDYIPLPGNRLAVALGDVAGKGTPAALLMARLSAFARFCLAGEPDVGKATEALNAALSGATNVERFVTFVAAVIDLKTFAVTLVNAGHPPPLLRRAGRVLEMGKDQAGLPLAVLRRPYETASFSLEPGDLLVFYTDGISEARNPKQDVYGLDRLTRLIESGPAGADQLGAAIITDVRRFSAERPQNDDVTLLCVERAGAG